MQVIHSWTTITLFSSYCNSPYVTIPPAHHSRNRTIVIMHTIDELAHLTGLPSRTIRFYNTQGLLPPPIMKGRVAYYDDEHLVVLNIIKQLKEQQNLPLETIRQMLEIRANQGEVMMNLALKQRLLRPLSAGEQNVQLSKEALMKQTGAKAEYIDELTNQGLLFPTQVDN